MRHILVESDVLGSRLSMPQIKRISHGYVWYESIKVYIQVDWYPLRGAYNIRVKLPKYKTLHLIWNEANFSFIGDKWLIFWIPVTSDGWIFDEAMITRVFDYIWFTD